MSAALMHLKVLLPFTVFAEKQGVSRIVAETLEGSMGILPQRLDCAVVLKAGILTFETDDDGEIFIAVDEGVLVKTGAHVLISVRNAFGGGDLAGLRAAVAREFAISHARDEEVRAVMAKLESGFIRRMVEFHHE